MPDPELADVLYPPPFTSDDLDAWLEEPAARLDAETVASADELHRWRPTDDRSAEWAMAKLVAHRRYIAEKAATRDEWINALTAKYEAEVAEKNEWFEAETKAAERSAAFFEGHLERWGREQRTDNKATFRLLSGVVKTTGSQARPSLADADAALRWVDDHPDLGVEVKRTVGITALQPHVRIVEHVWFTYAEDGCTPVWHPDAVTTELAPEVEGGEPVLVAHDPESGERIEGAVIEWDVVVGPDGVPVPGLEVTPAAVTVKVQPTVATPSHTA